MSTRLPCQPEIVHRGQRPYVAIGGTVDMASISAIADRFPEVFAWLSARGLQPAGAPFLRYHLIDMAGDLRIEAGVPIAAAVAEGDDQVHVGTLPEGRYATVVHLGHPAGLADATAGLLSWAAARGLTWDMCSGKEGERWGCRLESYLTDPAVEPDLDKWETELSIRLAS
jgi:effector-binding domain-containing protein